MTKIKVGDVVMLNENFPFNAATLQEDADDWGNVGEVIKISDTFVQDCQCVVSFHNGRGVAFYARKELTPLGVSVL